MDERFSVEVQLAEGHWDARLRADAAAGLTAEPKSLPPTWFYDDEGGRLFDLITVQPEYYPTRAEHEILADRAAEIAAAAGGARSLIELGSGSSSKARVLLDAVRPEVYVPMDVSRSVLEAAGAELTREYPRMAVRAVVGDFAQLRLPSVPGPRLVAFLGGTIGNLTPRERAAFLTELRKTLQPGDALLLGTDLVKDEATLTAAYDDAAGATAAFDKNVLTVLNRRLGADFDPSAFAHVVRWDAEHEWIEMRLRAERDLTVKLADLDLAIRFEAGEDLLTEISAKFRPGRVQAELEAAGLGLRRWWTDAGGRYALSLSGLP